VLLILVAVLAICGVGAGLLIRRFRKTKKHIKIITTIIGIIVLLVPFLFIVELFSGIFRYPFVSWRIHSYVARNYSDFDLTVNRVYFDFKDNYFYAQVHDSNNTDISFRISHGSGIIGDTHSKLKH
jgi:hypothetical protein